jgi:hypothetical protein
VQPRTTHSKSPSRALLSFKKILTIAQINSLFVLAGGRWLVLVCSERKVLLAGCCWLICSEREVLVG